MNEITSKDYKEKIKYILRGALNTGLKSKMKNKTHKLLNNSNIPRNLSELNITKQDSEETLELIEKVKFVMPDLKMPVIQLSLVSNILNKNILTNSRKGTYIKVENKDKYFKNIGNPIKSFSGNKGYFLRKGAASILIKHVIKEIKEQGINTILVHPLNSELEKYYGNFGFKIIPNVPTNIGRKQYFGQHIKGHIMYLEL
jgi:hypothetical protein